MTEILQLFWQLCQFKKGPQDVPASRRLYYFTVTNYMVVSLIMTKMTMTWVVAITNTLLGFMLLLGFIWAVLKWHDKLTRFYPTASAIFGVDSMLTLASVPVFAAVIFKLQPGVAFLFLVLLMLWQWAIVVNILRLSLSTSIAKCSGLYLVFLFASYKLFQLISGAG